LELDENFMPRHYLRHCYGYGYGYRGRLQQKSFRPKAWVSVELIDAPGIKKGATFRSRPFALGEFMWCRSGQRAPAADQPECRERGT
jgi:hypothetical protein